LPPNSINRLNIGGIIFGNGINSIATGNPTALPVLNAKAGVGTNNPQATWHIDGSLSLRAVDATASGTIAPIEMAVNMVTPGIILSLPVIATETGIGRVMIVSSKGGGSRVIAGTGNTIDGAGDYALTYDGDTVIIVATSLTNWAVVSFFSNYYTAKKLPLRNSAVNIAIAPKDYIINLRGNNLTATLPDINTVGIGSTYVVNTEGNNCTVAAFAGQTIEGQPNHPLTNAHDAMTVVAASLTNWIVISTT
jgi:hypothetical protein